MFFLQQPPPDTSAYMIAGYTVIFGAMLIYLISLIVRRRNLEQDIQLLEELEEKENRSEPVSSGQVFASNLGDEADT